MTNGDATTSTTTCPHHFSFAWLDVESTILEADANRGLLFFRFCPTPLQEGRKKSVPDVTYCLPKPPAAGSVASDMGKAKVKMQN